MGCYIVHEAGDRVVVSQPWTLKRQSRGEAELGAHWRLAWAPGEGRLTLAECPELTRGVKPEARGVIMGERDKR